MKSIAYLALASAILAIVMAGCVQAEDDKAGNQLGSARGQFALPKLFDFSRFKQLFKKSYKSLTEELARQKLFLARAFQAVISMVKYKNEKSDSYRSVNQFSDKTPAELRAMMLKPDQMRRASRRHLEVERLDTTTNEEVQEHELPVAGLEDIQQVIEEVKKHGDEPGYKEIAREFEQAEHEQLRRRKRQTGGSRKISMDDLMRRAKQDSREYSARVPSNNHDYEPAELLSYGLEDPEKSSPPMEQSLIGRISNLPGIGNLVSLVQKTSDEMAAPADKTEPKTEVAPDEIFVDHRESNCFFEPRQQGQCGSCWAFATVAMFEWLHCRQTGKLQSFSEQFMIDCGKFTSTDLGGCEGGTDDLAADFTFEFGLQLRMDYPYLERDGECPFERKEDMKKAGYLMMRDNKQYREVKLNRLDKALERSPLLLGLLVNDDFSFYGGGVDNLDNCGSYDMSHAMLIVGHGRQDGVEYYLFRNSYSTSWGEDGYYKLSKERFRWCAADPFAGLIRGSF